jgi:hypothetical protein
MYLASAIISNSSALDILYHPRPLLDTCVRLTNLNHHSGLHASERCYMYVCCLHESRSAFMPALEPDLAAIWNT